MRQGNRGYHLLQLSSVPRTEMGAVCKYLFLSDFISMEILSVIIFFIFKDKKIKTRLKKISVTCQGHTIGNKLDS